MSVNIAVGCVGLIYELVWSSRLRDINRFIVDGLFVVSLPD